MYPLPTAEYTAQSSDPELAHLLRINATAYVEIRFAFLVITSPQYTAFHSQWISDVLLHLFWANRTTLNLNSIRPYVYMGAESPVPLDAMLNRLLVCSIFLGSSIEEEVLKVQDKSYDISCSCPSGC